MHQAGDRVYLRPDGRIYRGIHYAPATVLKCFESGGRRWITVEVYDDEVTVDEGIAEPLAPAIEQKIFFVRPRPMPMKKANVVPIRNRKPPQRAVSAVESERVEETPQKLVMNER